jgi:cytidine deaminase
LSAPPIDPQQVANLIAQARDASDRAYAPYSNFRVGAAVMTDDGTVFTGCNVENASYGLTICAERVAVTKAVSAGHRRLVAVAVFTPTDTPTPPCGACRQVLNEFGPTLAVACAGTSGQSVSTLDALLPSAFGPGNLGG